MVHSGAQCGKVVPEWGRETISDAYQRCQPKLSHALSLSQGRAAQGAQMGVFRAEAVPYLHFASRSNTHVLLMRKCVCVCVRVWTYVSWHRKLFATFN